MDNPRMSERMEALLFASFFATPLHLYVGGGETTPDAGSTTHLALYAASAFVIGTLILSATRNLLSWLNPQAARGSHSGEAAATAAEQRAASRSPSPHHRPKPSTTRPPSRLQLTTGQQPHPPPTPKARLQHYHTPAAAAAATAPARNYTPICKKGICMEGWAPSFGLEHLSEPERKRKREHAQETDGGAKRRRS